MFKRLAARQQEINVAIIGIGSIGNGLVYQCHTTPGFKPVAIADIKIERAITCANWLGLAYEIVDNPTAVNETVRRGKLAISDNGDLIAQCAQADVLIEASSAIAAGGQHAITALKHGKHLVMMNYEADLLFGPALLALAKQNGRVYTSADGDQPTVIKRMVDEIEFWGFDLVMAGNIKGYLDRYTNPTLIIPEADKRNLDHKMCSSYTDGTKLGVEMAVLANALGLRTAVPGMIGPRCAHIHDIFDQYDFADLWRDRQGVVDYVLGAEPTGGVFVVGYTASKFQQFTLDWFPPKMGPGPFYLFYRPYHLGHIEALMGVAEAVLDGRSRLQPDYGLRTNVFSYAKKNLQAGETLDGMGGYACYGLIENYADGQSAGLPILLADDAVLKRPIAKDQPITLDDVAYDANAFQFQLYFQALEQSRRG
ncbi:MAG: homoserine dehydrogenase [Chloroflexi bacterium]|nr:homoserine dehydrogenase [Chloroflexota bacterium]